MLLVGVELQRLLEIIRVEFLLPVDSEFFEDIIKVLSASEKEQSIEQLSRELSVQ